MRAQLLLTVLLSMTTLPTDAQESKELPSIGRISGTVLNEEGQLMDHANVCTSRTSKSQTRINCLVFTDRDGRFQIERLKVGTYGLFAVKEEEGYTALNQGPREKIKITAERSSAMVTIRMSPRGGILIGSVKDKATGKPIHEARVMYQAVDIGNSGTTSADGNFRLPVPTGTELIVVVSAKGYKSWFYTDPSDSSRPVVRLDSGEQRVLDVELVPSSNE